MSNLTPNYSNIVNYFIEFARHTGFNKTTVVKNKNFIIVDTFKHDKKVDRYIYKKSNTHIFQTDISTDMFRYKTSNEKKTPNIKNMIANFLKQAQEDHIEIVHFFFDNLKHSSIGLITGSKNPKAFYNDTTNPNSGLFAHKHFMNPLKPRKILDTEDVHINEQDMLPISNTDPCLREFRLYDGPIQVISAFSTGCYKIVD